MVSALSLHSESLATEQNLQFLGSQPTVLSVVHLHSHCHLYDCWPLAGRDEY